MDGWMTRRESKNNRHWITRWKESNPKLISGDCSSCLLSCTKLQIQLGYIGGLLSSLCAPWFHLVDPILFIQQPNEAETCIHPLQIWKLGATRGKCGWQGGAWLPWLWCSHFPLHCPPHLSSPEAGWSSTQPRLLLSQLVKLPSW